MSVTSATEPFTEGAELFDQDKYQSTVTISREPHPHEMEQIFDIPLSQRIIPIPSHTKSIYGEYVLDNMIVRCPSEAFREHQKQQWNAVKKEAEEESWKWTVTLIGAGIIDTLGGILTFIKPVDVVGPLFLGTGLIGTVASTALMYYANSSYSQANDQINKWDADPVMKVGQKRDEAHERGFPYIYANGLKLGQGPSRTALFHPFQVKYEYEKYFESFCTKLLDQATLHPASWMNQFRSCNPLSSEYMTYGLGHIPEHMEPVLQDYTRFKSFLDDITSSYDKMKADVRKTSNERIEADTKTRNEQLQPLAKARDDGIATAEANRDRILRDVGADDTRRKEAKATFTAIKEALQDNYNHSASRINKKYEDKIKQIESDRDERIRKLDDQKSSQLGNNYKAARELLERAKQAWDNKGYQPVNFPLYFPCQTAQPVWLLQQPIPVYPQQPVYMYPQVPQYSGYGQFGYGHAAPIPAQQQYCYVPTGP